jgi:hypothetical protein
VFSFSAFSQSVHEIDVSAGVLTTAEIRNTIDNTEDFKNFNTKDGGDNQFNLSYKYFTKNKYGYGLFTGWEKHNTRIFKNRQRVGLLSIKDYTIAFEVYYRHVSLDWLQTYSGLGLGLTYIDKNLKTREDIRLDEYSHFFPAFHVNLFGVKIGYRIFEKVEFGFGYKGYLNFGVAYQFNTD